MFQVLQDTQKKLWARFKSLRDRRLELDQNLPTDPKELFDFAYMRGLQDGYGEGLTDGVELGLDAQICPTDSNFVESSQTDTLH